MIPIVKKTSQQSKGINEFPLDHYSYSTFTKFSTNPFMFKVNAINGDYIETTSSPTNVIGRSVHKALEVYFNNQNIDDGEAIKRGHQAGVDYLKNISDGLIEYSGRIPNRAKMEEKFAFAYFGYLKDINFRPEVKEILMVEKMLKYRVSVGDHELPIPLKGSADLVYRRIDNKIIIRDHKIVSSYSDENKMDGAKMIQTVFNYFLVYAELGEPPYSMIYEEFKLSKNRDNSKQTVEYEIVFDEYPLMFELFYRFYEDITNALLGKMVYVPNLFAIYDREVSLIAYIHRLDVDEVRDKVLKKLKVENITDFLKKKIQKDGEMKKYLTTVTTKFISAKTLNYKDMTIEDKIKMKLAEHGLGIEFHDKVIGGAVTLYRYDPSIGLKMSKIESYVKDIEQVVGVSGIRILAPIPNSEYIGFEVPLKVRGYPSEKAKNNGFDLAIGIDVYGTTHYMDIRKAPHMLVAGSTGSGKSVFIETLIQQLATFSPDEVQLSLLDPKMVELGGYAKGANTRIYKSDIMDIHRELQALVVEMNDRYKILQDKGYKNLDQYRANGGKLPYIFCFIDEYGDLIATNHVEIEKKVVGIYQKGENAGQDKVEVIKHNISNIIKNNILLLSQKARASGIHVILTTQRPSTNIVDGVIKANFPTRVAFRTSTSIDSMVIIDQSGAEKLLGRGDMLFLDPTKTGIERLQGFTN